MMHNQTMKARLKSRMTALEKEQSSWRTHWRELSDFIQPRRGQSINRGAGDTRPGGKRNQKIINNTATLAARMLVSAMMSGVVNPANRWFRLDPSDQDLRESGPVKQWLQWPEQKIYDSLAASNFYGVMPTVIEDSVIFGTGVYGQFEDRDTISRFVPYQIGEYYLANGEDGKVSTIYRQFQETVENIVQRFDRENCSDAVKTAWDNGNWDARFTICHAIERSSDRHDNMPAPWKSIPQRFDMVSMYWEHAGGGDGLLGVKGFEETAVHAMRWVRSDPEAYGRSPGMDALGDIKQLQASETELARIVQKVGRPPTQGPARAGGDPIDQRPGEHNIVDQNTGGVRHLLENWRPDPSAMGNEILRLEGRVRNAFYADVFVMNSLSARSQITAREIDERSDEKLQVLGPVLTQISAEGLDPTIDRQFNLIIRGSMGMWPDAGIVPPPPPELEGREIKVSYIGPLQMAQMAQKTRTISQFLNTVLGAAQAQPKVLDKVDWDQLVDEVADSMGIDPDVVNTDDAVEAIRQAQAEQAQMQQAMEMAKTGADAIGKVAPAMEG